MKVKPMIFNTEMVKALLDGRKTVTRRPWKGNSHKPCNIGDLLYVRETFCIGKIDECDAEHPADRHLFVSQCKGDNNYIPKQWLLDDGISIEDVTFKPSIHMPRHASRITLKVTDVRIEKLNDLRKSDEQVKREGFENWPQFKHVWESIYGQSKPNDYVWVIEFEVIHQNVDKYLSSLSLPE
ncbi:ASCH domain-containing protein [Vibrio fluvialis]|nr:ASCH domain-containing protein [Vibrio fluvialis]EKO3527599.1 ASCH domain-containing protein [Vibrio fluvialis]ELP3312405.1 ASCH domain-containing protein [Vibrio fluvialis]